jgi:hypothetical protein
MDQALTPQCIVHDFGQDRARGGLQARRGRAEKLAPLDGPKQLPKLIQGVKFTDGIEVVVNTSAPHARNPWRHET